jgi:hypothetical protein
MANRYMAAQRDVPVPGVAALERYLRDRGGRGFATQVYERAVVSVPHGSKRAGDFLAAKARELVTDFLARALARRC